MEKQEDIMNGNAEEQIAIKEYLLGVLGDKTQMRQIEEKILLDDKFAEMLSVAEDKLIEDYLDNDLSKEHRKHFVEFFLAAPERAQQFRLTKNVRRRAAKVKTVPAKKFDFRSIFRSMFSSPAYAAAAFAVLILLILAPIFFVRNGLLSSSETQMVTQLLDRAYKSERPFEARVSGLGYAPYNITRGEDPPQVNQRELDAADQISSRSALSGDTAESLQNAGRIYLVKGETDKAIAQFEKAAELAPPGAETLNDLGVAYLEKSRSRQNVENGAGRALEAKALENFNKAAELDPALLAAWFNKALTLQLMGLGGEAKNAWQEYLKLDANSKWAGEARRNLEALPDGHTQNRSAGEILQDFLSAYEAKENDRAYQIVSRNREMISGKLIPQQLVFLFLTGPKEDRNKHLSALHYIGQAENERSGDPYFLNIARYYSSSTEAQREVLQKAHEFLNNGYDLCLKDDCHGAADVFGNAREMFKRAGNVDEAKLSDYWIGYALFREGKVAESTQLLRELADFCQGKSYKWLAAQAFSWLAINMYTTRDLSRSLDYDRKALVLAKQVSDLYLTDKVLSQIADTYGRFGDYSEAMEYIGKALEMAALPDASLRQKWRDYDAAANIFFATKNYEAALAYKKESIGLAAVTNESTFFSTAYTGIGLIYGTQKKYKEALESFDKSREVIAGFQDEALKNKFYAYNLLQMAHIERQAGDCGKALKNYEEAISLSDISKFPAYAYDGYKGRLLCYYENNDDASFQAELPTVLRLSGEYRAKITEEQNRNIFFNNEQNVYDIAIDQEFNKTNYDKAFEYSEQSRARTLLDLQNAPVQVSDEGPVPEIKLPSETVEPLDLGAIQSRMPANVQLVQYSVLADKTVVWLITKDEFSAAKADITSELLSNKTAAYIELVAKSDDANSGKRDELAKELYRMLIAPIAGKLDAGKKICLIPDKILSRLPFSTLISPESGKYFIAQYSFFISPSANIFLMCSEKAASFGRNTTESLLSIGNPDFNKEEFPGLKELTRAEAEARDILQFYNGGAALTGKGASKSAVEARLPNANVIHFAGHYLVNDRQPLLSGFVLAANTETNDLSDSLLANHEIIRGKFVNVKLIVLSACQTGVERFYNGEGMIGSARAFLAAGVPLVVASQWKVDSAATAALMTRFHRYRKQDGLSTVEALRRAQLDMLEGGDEQYRDPYYWAAFETIGGYAEF